MQTNQPIVQRFCTACENGNTNELSKVLADDFRLKVDGRPETVGRPEFLQAIEQKPLRVEPAAILTPDVKDGRLRSLTIPTNVFDDLAPQLPEIAVPVGGVGIGGGSGPSGSGYRPTPSNPGKYSVPAAGGKSAPEWQGKAQQTPAEHEAAPNRPTRPGKERSSDDDADLQARSKAQE